MITHKYCVNFNIPEFLTKRRTSFLDKNTAGIFRQKYCHIIIPEVDEIGSLHCAENLLLQCLVVKSGSRFQFRFTVNRQS